MARFPEKKLDASRWKKGVAPKTHRKPNPKPASPTAWEAQAEWYDARQGERGDDFHRGLVLPAVIGRLAATAGQTVLDVCCGNGVLGRTLAESQVRTVGIDASPSLITAAAARAGEAETYRVGDAHKLLDLFPGGGFDHAALVLALQDLDPIEDVLAGTAALVRPGGRVVVALTHPCFRIPRLSGWGWDEDRQLQYRRVDGYLTGSQVPIRTHPGKSEDTASTQCFNRPLSAYLNALGVVGLPVTASDELCSRRRGTLGSRAEAEDRACREFPVFLVLTAVKVG